MCGAVLNTSDPLMTALELPCEHEICAKCYVTAEMPDFEETNKITCLICGENFKLYKAYRTILSIAR